MEEWSNQAALQHQVRLPRFPQLLNVAERLLTPPEIAFELEHDTRGLDYVNEVKRNVDDS